MLLFFLFPRYFLNSPVAREEKRFLRNHVMNRSYVRIAFAFVVVLIGLIAASPLWHYMGPGTPPELLFMIGLVYTFHVGIAFFIADQSSKTITRQITERRWDDLILTGVDARQIVISKWCVATISLMPLHIISSLLKLGVAYGLAQYLNVTEAFHPEVYGTALWYASPNFPNFLSPSLLKTIAGMLILYIYSIAEGGFITALGIMSGLFATHWPKLAPLIAVTLRGSLIIGTVILWLGIGNQTWKWWDLNLTLGSHNFPVESLYGFWGVSPVAVIHDWQHLFEFVQMTISPLADSGTVLTADMLRPLDTHFHALQSFVSAGFGLLPFFIFTWLSLRVAQIMAVRRGALATSFQRV